MRFSHAPGYTKEMGNILARGARLTFWRGSCLKATVAKARLGVIGDYLQAVLQEPEVSGCINEYIAGEFFVFCVDLSFSMRVCV